MIIHDLPVGKQDHCKYECLSRNIPSFSEVSDVPLVQAPLTREA